MPAVADASAEPAPMVDEANWFGTHDHAVAEEAAARSMAALVGRIIGAKPFPMSARRLADLTRLEVVRIEPVIQVLETDPGLSARLLRLVNSAGYALRQRCTSVRHAATLVGTDRLHQIATTAAVLDLFDSKGPIATQIIEHSTVVGAFCRYLGAHLALPVDDLFTAGFLHDIGKLMLIETEGEQYVELFTRCASRADSLHHLERRLYGFDHAALAAHVLSAWNIPDPVPKIVGWHHEPAQAYKVSSLMASLVQTVRLSDAIAYAMQHDGEQVELKDLAKHEAANYLEISEPQLAAMWTELRVLFDECRQQCLGENAPALDPRSLRPRQPIALTSEPVSERSHELPKQFPCVECGCPTFGNTCPACGGHVCPDHQVGANEWCTICARDYEAEKSSLPVSQRARWALGALGAAILLSGCFGMLSAGSAGALRAGFGTLLLGLLAGLLYVIGKTWLVRTRFVRSRPNRFVAEPQVNDGGTQSLVPALNADDVESATSQSVNWLKANIHLVEPLKEITIRELSGSELRNETDLQLPPNASIEQPKTTQPSTADSAPASVDPVRVQLQSESLVTLPAPAQHEPHVQGPAQTPEHTPVSTRERAPRDTLTEHDATQQAAISAADKWPESEAGTAGSRMQPQPETTCAQEPSAGQFSLPLVAFRDVDAITERSSGESDPVKWEAPALESLSSALAPTAPAELRPATDESSQSSEVIAIAQPIAPINAQEGNAANTGTLQSSASAQPETPANEVRAPPAEGAPPAAVEQGSTPAGGPGETVYLRDATSSNTAPTETQLRELAGEYASRLGNEFESRVRELAAQRVAQLIAERFLAAFDVDSLIKERMHSSLASREDHEPTATTKPRKRKRSP